MKKIITIFFSALYLVALSSPVLALNNWEAGLTVTSGHAKSNLSFGQNHDATDLTDGFYDVPAMLSGNLQSYFQNEEGSFWRDIRAIESEKEWQLIITSQTEKPIHITWNPALFPPDKKVSLVDALNAKETDMQSASTYTMVSTNNTIMLLITVTTK